MPTPKYDVAFTDNETDEEIVDQTQYLSIIIRAIDKLKVGDALTINRTE